MSFAESMKRYRMMRKFSQTDLERVSGISQSAISSIERGEKSPTEETMNMIAKALRVPLSDMLENEKSPAAGSDEAEINELVMLLNALRPGEIQRVRDFVSGLLASQSE